MLNRQEIEQMVSQKVIEDIHAKNASLEIKRITDEALTAFRTNTLDFSKYTNLIIRKSGKKRFVKLYRNPYSPESVMCRYVKQILDRTFRIEYTNRNKTIKALFDILPSVAQMPDFTIIKIDFRNYFNSVSTSYVYEKCIATLDLDPEEDALIRKYAVEAKYAYAGLFSSNTMAEVIGMYFDEAIRKEFQSCGISFFQRYVDDSLLIINQYVSKEELDSRIDRIVESTFRDPSIKVRKKCKTRLNLSKSEYLTRKDVFSTSDPLFFDFLGYLFTFEAAEDNSVVAKYGITRSKRYKYSGKLDNIIEAFASPSSPEYQDMELLRQRIAAFTSRNVFMAGRHSMDQWRTKGVISKYGQLRDCIDTGLLEPDTDVYLRTLVDEAFARAGVERPYFLKSKPNEKNGYNLLGNMQAKKSIILVEKAGYDYPSLVRLCQRIGIPNEVDGKKLSYHELVHEYLIKSKIGF